MLDLVGLLEAIPFDPERSPWDVTVIDGLEGGRAALYLRAHHVLTDGIGGIRLLGLLLDEPAWPRVRAPARRPATRRRRRRRDGRGDRPPGTFTSRGRPRGRPPLPRRRAGRTRHGRDSTPLVTPRCAACSGRSTSPTRCPAS